MRSSSSTAVSGSQLHLFSDLDAIVADIFHRFYQFPYPNSKKNRHGIARVIHGITHVTRAANYIYPLANLYRYYGDVEAQRLTEEDIRLLQIAALLHDSAREGEAEDLWDQASALNIYYYLTKNLRVPAEKARIIAEAMANKDASDDNYKELLIINGHVFWEPRKKEAPKNIYQKLIHDADCLDIIRARPVFDANFLDFYQDIASINQHAFDSMAKIITEVRCLIDLHGDAYQFLNWNLKKQFEHAKANQVINQTIHPEFLLAKLQGRLYSKAESYFILNLPIPEDKALIADEPITAELLTHKMQLGKLFARSLVQPSNLTRKEIIIDGKVQPCETRLEVEIRKMQRRLGVPTRTKKVDTRLLKNGNPFRSVSLLGWGASVFSDVGFLIVDPDMKAVHSVNAVDSNSGFMKKSALKKVKFIKSPEEQKALLDILLDKQKMGGCYTVFNKEKFTWLATHNEVLYTITTVNAVYFTRDDTFHNRGITSENLSFQFTRHRYAPILLAIYMQQEYKRIVGSDLPIFEYSGNQNVIKAYHYTDDDILAMWETAICDLLKHEIEHEREICFKMSVNDLMLTCVHGYYTHEHTKPLDENYSAGLKAKIHTRLTAIRDKFHNQLLQELHCKKLISKIYLGERPVEDYMKIVMSEKTKESLDAERYCKLLIMPIQHGYTPLEAVLRRGSVQQIRDYFGAIRAAREAKIINRSEYCNLLIEPSEEGENPLYSVIKSNNPENIKAYFAEIKAARKEGVIDDIQYKQLLIHPTDTGHTPLHVALIANDQGCLKSYMKEISEAHKSNIINDIEYKKILIENICCGYPLLHFVTKYGKPENLQNYLTMVLNASDEKMITHEDCVAVLFGTTSAAISVLQIILASNQPRKLQSYLATVCSLAAERKTSMDSYRQLLFKMDDSDESTFSQILKTNNSNMLNVYLQFLRSLYQKKLLSSQDLLDIYSEEYADRSQFLPTQFLAELLKESNESVKSQIKKRHREEVIKDETEKKPKNKLTTSAVSFFVAEKPDNIIKKRLREEDVIPSHLVDKKPYIPEKLFTVAKKAEKIQTLSQGKQFAAKVIVPKK